MKTETDLPGQPAQPRSLRRALKSAILRVKSRSPHWMARARMHEGEDGSALVEFALILPMLLLLTTGIFVFGIAMNNYLQLTNAVSMAARTLAVSAGLTKDPCALGYTSITNSAPALNPANFTFSYTLNGTVYTGSSCSSASTSTGAAGNLSSGSNVTVTATYPLNLTVFGEIFSPSNAVLQATSTELVQ